MKRVVSVLYWQWAFLFAALLVLTTMHVPHGISGMAVLETEETDPFAAPYDPFSGEPIIMLSAQPTESGTYHILVDVGAPHSRVYNTFFSFANGSWQEHRFSTSEEWLGSDASAELSGPRAEAMEREGDDLFVGVWVCKAAGDAWQCGCKAAGDCGYWHLQGVDLDSPLPCQDDDGDGYGAGSGGCQFSLADCDDSDALINPGAEEIPYTGKDEDCSAATPDDDLDEDGFLLAEECDDSDAAINPAAQEVCGDGTDQDCDGQELSCELCAQGAVPPQGCSCSGTPVQEGFCCEGVAQASACGVEEALFADDFESGTASSWDYLNPNSQVNGDHPRTGTYSLDLIYSGTGLKGDQYADRSLPAQEHLFHRAYVYFEEDFVHAVSGLWLSSLGGASLLVRQYQADPRVGRLSVLVGGQEFLTAATLSNGQWYCLEEEVSSGGVLRLWVDDVLVADHADLPLEAPVMLRQGGTYLDSIADPVHVYVDDVIVSGSRVGCS